MEGMGTTQEIPLQGDPKRRGTSFRKKMSGLLRSAVASAEDESSDLDTGRGEAPMGMVHPDSAFKNGWDWLIIALVVFSAYMVPLQITFLPPWTETSVFSVFSIAIDVLFFLDIVVTVRTGLPDTWGAVTYDSRKIWRAYARGMLVIDLLAVIPFEVVAPNANLTFASLLKLPRLLRLGRLTKKFELLASANTLRVVVLLLGFLLMAHILACAWWFLGAQMYNCIVNGNCKTALNDVWISRYWEKAPEDIAITDAYLASLHFTLTTMTTVGYGDIQPVNDTERLFACIMLTMAAAAYAMIFGNVAVQMKEFDRTVQRYNHRVKSLRDFFGLHQMEPAFLSRTMAYVDSLWDMSKGLDTDETLSTLPPALRADIMMALHERLVQKVNLFNTMSPAFIKAIVVRLKPEVALKGDYIVREGDEARAMYFVYKGVVVVERMEKGQLFHVRLGTGQFFGESALLSAESTVARRNASVFAETLSHLYVLSSADFAQVTSDFPEYKGRLRESEIRRFEVAAYERKISTKSKVQAVALALRMKKGGGPMALTDITKAATAQAAREHGTTVVPVASAYAMEGSADRAGSFKVPTLQHIDSSSSIPSTAPTPPFTSTEVTNVFNLVRGAKNWRHGAIKYREMLKRAKKLKPDHQSLPIVAAVILQKVWRHRWLLHLETQDTNSQKNIMMMHTSYIFELTPWIARLRVLVAKKTNEESGKRRESIPLQVNKALRWMNGMRKKAMSMQDGLAAKLTAIEAEQEELLELASAIFHDLAVDVHGQDVPVASLVDLSMAEHVVDAGEEESKAEADEEPAVVAPAAALGDVLDEAEELLGVE